MALQNIFDWAGPDAGVGRAPRMIKATSRRNLQRYYNEDGSSQFGSWDDSGGNLSFTPYTGDPSAILSEEVAGGGDQGGSSTSYYVNDTTASPWQPKTAAYGGLFPQIEEKLTFGEPLNDADRAFLGQFAGGVNDQDLWNNAVRDYQHRQDPGGGGVLQQIKAFAGNELGIPGLDISSLETGRLSPLTQGALAAGAGVLTAGAAAPLLGATGGGAVGGAASGAVASGGDPRATLLGAGTGAALSALGGFATPDVPNSGVDFGGEGVGWDANVPTGTTPSLPAVQTFPVAPQTPLAQLAQMPNVTTDVTPGIVAPSPIANWAGNDVGDQFLGEGAIQNLGAAGTNVGSPAAGTGWWSGNTFAPNGQVIPFGAQGDATPQATGASTTTPGAGTGETIGEVAQNKIQDGAPSMFDIGSAASGALNLPLALIAGSSLLGGKMQADAASDAARIQADASDRAIAANERAATASLDENRRQYDTTRADLAPYREAGTGALGQLRSLAGDQGNNGAVTRDFTTDDFWKDPVVQLGYQSGLDLGKTALYNAAPLTTGRDSGAALKELTKFGTDYTGSKAADSFSRFKLGQSDVFNKLASMAGIGQNATNTGAVAGSTAANTAAGVNMNAGTNAANLLAGQGNAGAASRIAGTNAWTGALGNIANWWQSQSLINRMFPQAG